MNNKEAINEDLKMILSLGGQIFHKTMFQTGEHDHLGVLISMILILF